MNNPNQALPKYERPPVVEVALSVQFEELSALRTPQIGMLWDKFRTQFPKTEEHQPIEPSFEKFGVRVSQKPSIRFEQFDAPPVPRMWFLNSNGTELLQVQQDRFIHNWRKVDEDDRYPHYDDRIKNTFQENLIVFENFLKQENIGELIPNQCEVTYINHVISGDGWEHHGELDKVLSVINAKQDSTFLSEPEDSRISLRYLIPDSNNSDNDPIGRLHISCDPVFRKNDDKAMFLVKLTARGYPTDKNIEGVLNFMDIGREWVVRGFTSITTEPMHRIWRRNNGS